MSDDLSGDMLAPSWPNLVLFPSSPLDIKKGLKKNILSGIANTFDTIYNQSHYLRSSLIKVIISAGTS